MAEHRFFAHIPLTMLPGVWPGIAGLRQLGLELALDHEALAPGFAAQARRLGESLRTAARACRFHAPFRNLAPGGHDPEAVALTRRRLEAALALAPLFGVEQIVAHPDWDPDGDALDVAGFLDRSERFWLSLAPAVEAAGCRIGLENVFDRDPAVLAALLERLPASCYGATFDVGHWHAYSRAGLAEWMEAVGGRIVGLHIHDNHGVADEHLPVGAGSVPWQEYLGAIGEMGRGLDCVLENRSRADLAESLRFLSEQAKSPAMKPVRDLAEQLAALPEGNLGGP